MPAISKHTGHASMAFRLLENPGEDMDGRIGRRASESAGGARPKGESLTEGWPDIPAPIMAERARQSPYPEDAFPPDLEDLLQAVQRLAQCPAAIAGAALLGALALLAQHDFKVETLAPHLSPPSLFLVPFPLEYALYRIFVSPVSHSRASRNPELEAAFQYQQI